MPKILRPTEVYKILPGINCKLCGEENCMAFAAKLIEKQKTLEDCKPLFTDRFKDKLSKALELIRPFVGEVTIGIGDRTVTIGGKVCMYRHELTWYRPTALFFDIDDSMPEEEALARVKYVENFEFERIGFKLRLDGVAIRHTSGSIEKFAKRVAKVVEVSKLPIILCSYDVEAMEEALTIAGSKRPLIYAANKENWLKMFKLASEYRCPLALSASGDLSLLKSLASSARKAGIEDLVLDPGTFVEEDGLNETVNMLTMLRASAIEGGDRDLGYPLMAVPAVVWLTPLKDEAEVKMRECLIANILITKFADLLIMHTTDIWTLLPILTWRQNVYTDPRVPLAVKAGLYEVGRVDEKTPIFVTCNSALTYSLVKGDVEKSGGGYIICIDTDGISVASSVPGKRFTADKVAETLKETGVEKKVKHRAIIIPGRAAPIAGELEEKLLSWRIFVGPRECSGIPHFVKTFWSREVKFD